MLDSNSNKKLLGIKDPNITIQSVEEEKYHGERCLMVKATLCKEMKRCPFCHQANENHSIIKNGKKGSKILLNKSNNQKTYLHLQKQRYCCRLCQSYWTASTYLYESFIASMYETNKKKSKKNYPLHKN